MNWIIEGGKGREGRWEVPREGPRGMVGGREGGRGEREGREGGGRTDGGRVGREGRTDGRWEGGTEGRSGRTGWRDGGGDTRALQNGQCIHSALTCWREGLRAVGR